MTAADDRDRFRRLPEPVLPEDTVETVDAESRLLPDEGQERDRLLRDAGGGG
jgi:hypothetical protein